jgi:predicted enzyme related to lactoylglutathione lyase
MSTFSITHTDFVFVPVTDFERADAFYTGVLGLPRSTRYGQLPGGEYETGNLTLQLMDVRAIGIEHRVGAGVIALHVDDVAAARQELESRGVSFRGDIIDSGVCHMALFADPDGNGLMLHHRYAP